MNFYLSVAISAGIGTALVEAVFKLFLEHWLKEKYYLFTINKADRRECSDKLLEIINPVNNPQWDKFGSEIYTKSFLLMDRLVTLRETASAEKLGSYTSNQMILRFKMVEKTPAHQMERLTADIIDMERKIGSEREELLRISQNLRG